MPSLPPCSVSSASFGPTEIIFVASVAIQVAAIAAYLLGAERAAPPPHDAID